MLKLEKTQIAPLAKVLLARLSELEFSCKGKPPVIDQAFELVAALGGYRNQHAMRAALASNGGAEAPAIVQEPFGIVPEAKAILERKGYRVGVSYYHRPYWEFVDLGSIDFDSVDQAWADAWNHAANAAKSAGHLSDSDWAALGVYGQLTMVDAHIYPGEQAEEDTLKEGVAEGSAMLEEIAKQQAENGEEHPVWTRSHWGQEASDGDTQLGYWEWVVHQLEAASFDDNHEKALALGFNSVAQMREHADWLKKNGSLEYKKWLADLDRSVADVAFEEFDFGPAMTVAAHNGWEMDGDGEFAKTVFLENAQMPHEPTTRVVFVVRVENGEVKSCDIDNFR